MLLVIPFLAYFGVGNSKLKSDEVEFYTLIWQIVIGASALILFISNMFKEKANYLHLNVEVIERNGYGIIRTEVSNQIADDKEVNSALLLITPVGSDILGIVNSNMDTLFKSFNSFFELKHRYQIINDEFGFIPLSYYSAENIRVGNENLSFEIPFKLPLKTFGTSNKQFYDVRFFVFRNTNDVNSLHRVVACSVEVQKSLKQVFVEIPKSNHCDIKNQNEINPKNQNNHEKKSTSIN